MILATALIFAAIQNAPAGGEPSPEVKSAQNYAECVGMAAVLDSASTPSIKISVKRAFDKCQPERAIAVSAITASFKAGGLDDARASQEAQDLLRERDQWMAEQLKADIAYHRRTGEIPSHASNQ